MFKSLAAFLGVIAFVCLLGFGLNYAGYLQYGFFAPRMEQVRNDTFHNSQAYNDGMLREMEEQRMAYATATPDQKDAIKGLLKHDFSVYPKDRLPADLLNFYNSLTGG